jgi:metal-responsive CopG/Arc/MetJ family transcriptional regulator
MSVAKIAITMEEGLVEQVDRLLRDHVYPNRSRAIQDAVADKLQPDVRPTKSLEPHIGMCETVCRFKTWRQIFNLTIG